MASKIKLNLDPNEKLDVVEEVEIPTPTGKPLKIKFDFIYRNRVEVADLVDQHAKRAREAIDQAIKQQADDDKIAGREFALQAGHRDVQAIQDIATGWNLELEFDQDNLLNLCIKYPGAGRAISERYRQCMVEGRLGN